MNNILRVILGLLLGILLGLMVQKASAEECLPEPMSGIQSGRWTVVDPCYSLTAYVNGYVPSSGGAYWLSIMSGDRSYSAKTYPQFGLPRPEAFEWVVLTGALVTEVSDASGNFTAPFLWTELVPVWAMQRPDFLRDYNEQRDDGWYRVVVLRRSAMHDSTRYYSHFIEPADYEAAGIPE